MSTMARETATAIDRWSIVNLAVGVAAGYYGASCAAAATASVLFELVEDRGRPYLDGVMPDAAIVDSKSNALIDVLAVVVGCAIGGKLRGGA